MLARDEPHGTLMVMERIWAAEILVDIPLATALVGEQFPNFAPVHVEPLGSGWDNTAYRVNHQFVFRFPRREVAVPLIETELACLPILGPRLPVPIPIPIYAGRRSASYPWPFAGYAYLSGQHAPNGELDPTWRRNLAKAMGEFLRALHAVPADALPSDSIPFDTLARLDAAQRRQSTEERLASLRTSGIVVESEAILAILDSAPEPPEGFHPVVVHGDLHAGQLLVTEQGHLAGVIDWGDLHLGHREVDLAAVHQLIPSAFHDAFLSSYGGVDETAWQLAKARATWHAVALLAYAVDTRDEPLRAEAMLALGLITERDVL